MNRDSNGFITTDSELLGFEVPVLYSGASGINVDNENYIISFTGTAYGSGGKTYQGVSPIVVNNDEDKISANTTPFGVQSPLYFAQDDESGCVIGFSGDVDPAILSSKLDISAFEAWQTGQYTNDLSTITNNITAISSEIPNVSQFVTSSDLSTVSSEITSLIPNTAGLASETYVQEQVSSKLDESAYSTQSGNFLTAIPAEYATQDWVTGQNYLTSVPPEYSTSSDLVTLSSDIVSQIPDVSNYATLTDLENTSADITAMIPSTAGLATETYVNENTSGKLDTTAFSTVSGDFLTAHQSLVGYATETYVDENVSGKLDSSTFASLSGDFATTGDLNDYALETTVESLSSSITSMIPSTAGLASETYVDQNISSKLDSTAFSTVSGNFLTAVDLSNYYPKTDTSSKDELDYAFSHITGGGGSTYTSPLNTILVDNINSTLEGTDSAYVTDAPIEALISTANGLQQSETMIAGNKLSWDFTVRNEGILIGTSRLNFTAYNEFNQLLTSRQITSSNGTHLVSSYYNPSATHFYAKYLITSGNFSAISSYIGSGTVQLARKYELENYQPLSSMDDYALRSWVSSNYLSRGAAREAYAKLSALETVSSEITAMIPSTAGLASTTYVDESVSSKLDSTAFSTVSGDFLTAVDLSPYQTTAGMVNYQTTAGMTAYQPAGDYATTSELEQVSGEITALIPSTAGLASENYVQTNSAVLTGMIDAKQDALTFGYDENDKINSINNSAIAGGGGGNPEVEAYVTSNSGSIDETVSTYQTNSGNYLQASDISAAEWNDCYDNVSTNSGVWGGSALPISAGHGVKLEVVNNTLVVSNDETLLWETTAYNGASAFTLSEPYTNFDRLGIFVARGQGNQTTPYGYSGPLMYFDCDGIITGTYKAYGSLTPALMERQYWKYSVYSAVNTTNFRWVEGGEKNILSTAAGSTAASWTAAPTIRKVIGVGRRN